MAGPKSRNTTVWLERVLYVFAAIHLGRAMIWQNAPNFDMHMYAHKVGEMPFQTRYLMVPVLLWTETNNTLVRASEALSNSTHGSISLTLEIVNSLCLIALGWITTRIRSCFEPKESFHWLSRWLLLWIVAVDFVVRYEQSIYTPYDMTSMLFFNLAMYFCIRRNLQLYLLTVAVSMFNRETTVFLLFVWFACTIERSRLKAIGGAVITGAYYVFVRRLVTRILGRKETGIEFAWHVNKMMLLPHHWPQILSLGGFLVLPLWLYRNHLQDGMLKRVWLGLVPWFIAALTFGWWNETRVFGEASVLCACSAALLFENLARERFAQAAEALNKPHPIA